MKKINLKSPRYVLPLICLPFILLLFLVYRQQTSVKDRDLNPAKDSLRSDLTGVSEQIQQQKLQDKLQVFQDRYRKADGYSALGPLNGEEDISTGPASDYSSQEKKMLDSIESSIRLRYSSHQPGFSGMAGQGGSAGQGPKSDKASLLSQDRALAAALKEMSTTKPAIASEQKKTDQDPMAIFKAQMAIVDSLGKANDPSYKSELSQQRKREALQAAVAEQKTLKVTIAQASADSSNTILSETAQQVNIPAVIDQELTGYSGSRIRMRLLADIRAGKFLIKKGSYLYGSISSFSAQRIGVQVSSVLNGGEILPVHLEVYDLDGLKGIYVPASTFREFTRELGSSSSQGLSLESGTEENKQLMSLLGRVFQSASGAVTRLVRQNKARIKYCSLVYLIDPDQLSSRQKNF
jgi:conjugative transposon TraM protein